MDYSTIITTSNMVFQGDTTYLLASNNVVNLSGTTVIEPGCVIKLGASNPGNTAPIINILGPLDCQTRPYAPCVITSRDDKTVGHTNASSTALLTNAYGAYHLCFPASNTNAIQVHDIRSRYAYNAFGFLGTNSAEAWNIQAYGTQGDVFEGAGNSVTLRNVLVNSANNVGVPTANNTKFIGEHFTVHIAGKAFSAGSFTGCSMALTNSLLVVVTNTSSSGLTTVSGHTLTDDSGVFQTVGAGSHYLADGSPYRNTGSTTISTNLSAGVFKYSTTYPPALLTGPITVDTLLTQQVSRDLDAPDEGYHYPAIDWALSSVTNKANLTLTNGVAVAWYGTTGLYLDTSSRLISEGTPLTLNRLVRYNTVQEQPVSWGSDELYHAATDDRGVGAAGKPTSN